MHHCGLSLDLMPALDGSTSKSGFLTMAQAIVVTLMLSACAPSQSSKPEGEDLDLVDSSVQPTITEIATSHPTASQTQAQQEPPYDTSRAPTDQTGTPAATPALPGEFLDHLFFEQGISDCQLPCWKGLEIGVSTIADLQDVFDRELGFSGYFYPLPQGRVEAPGYDRVGHDWNVDNSADSYFAILAWYKQGSNVLQGLDFFWGTDSQFQSNMSPQRVMQQLGEPDYFLASFELGGQGKNIHLTTAMLMIYKIGVSFYYSGNIPVQMSEDNVTPLSAQFCLNDDFSKNAGIRQPFPDDFDDLSSLQEMALAGREQLTPIEDILLVSVSELASRAMTEENPCFTIKAADQD